MNQTSVDYFLAQHDRPDNRHNIPWLFEQQSRAIESFREKGFPTTRLEDWKYTDVKPILKREFTLPEETPVDIDHILPESARPAGLECHELVFVNGRPVSGNLENDDLPAGVIIKPLQQAIDENDGLVRQHLNRYAGTDKNGFSALNTAYIRNGAAVFIPENTILRKPLHLLYLSDRQEKPFASNPRNLLVLEKNAQAAVIETYIGTEEAEYLTNTVTEIRLSGGASLEHYKLQRESMNGFHIGNTQVHQQADSHFTSHSVSLGGKLARNDIDVRLLERGAEVTLNGLYIAGKSQHIDNHTRVDHLSPHTGSTETYRGVLSGRSRGVFNGKVVVHKGAFKTNAHQSNANLLLSDSAEVDTKPELEIYADDVKCTHGATIGQLDKNMLFYLRSRAIPEDLARSLLTFAFAGDVIRRIRLDPIRRLLEYTVLGRLPDAGTIREFVR